MAHADEFGEDLADFLRRVGELRAARTVPDGDLRSVLDTALFELDHVAEQLWPRFEQLAATRGQFASRQEEQLLRAVFQRLPLPVVLMDRDTVVRRMNFAASGLTAVRAGYATGRPFAGVFAHADRAALRAQTAAVARGEGDRSLTLHLQQQPSDGIRATLTALRPGAERHPVVLVVLQPGTSHRLPRPERLSAPEPDLAEATRNASLLDLHDAMTTELLSAPAGDRAALLRRVAAVLHGRFADWVVADLGARQPVRTQVLGPTQESEAVDAVARQDPAACPLVVEAARGGSTALQVRPEDPDAFGGDADGVPVLVRADVTSLLCVPLSGPEGGPVEGVLTLFRCGARLAFSLAEAQAVDVMSRHVALALRKLR
ncbi:PAS domain-containing protein [Streptomyces sp. TRM66268-LWL]|uniref:PAS domain-containing protein n=1 Tax=Streptomyces polyasparticus TaxID=2767826 RepID=A0ABR7SDY4_9ACTN|nr:PAS domain-containing protein [Streptomyces polyasparticus]MBC9713389.1 PAS domain-containing protein [Streptomyces polyasparticus]